MRKKLILIPVALFFFNGVFAQTSSGLSTEKLLEFNTYIQDEIDAENIAGAEILIAQNDVVAWQESFGNRNENGNSVDQEQYLLHSVHDQTLDQCCDNAAC